MSHMNARVFEVPTRELPAPTIFVPAQTRAPVEKMRQSDPVNLEWWSPDQEPPGHVAINYSKVHERVPDWTELMAGLMKRHRKNYVIVIGPHAKTRDAKATRARNAILESGAVWANSEPGEEEKIRLDLQKELFEIQELSNFAMPGEDASIDSLPDEDMGW